MDRENLTNWQLHTTTTQDCVWYGDCFSDYELDAIVSMGETQDLTEGSIGDTSCTDTTENMRKSRVSWITPAMPEAEWLFRRLTDVILRANEDYFNFDLAEIEHLQFTVYDREGDHYDWHRDMLPQMPGRMIRKLSFSLLLDDPQDYQGGDLELFLSKQPMVADKERGKIIFFPGYALHRVTPVTQGTRRSLVGWVRGPGWK